MDFWNLGKGARTGEGDRLERRRARERRKAGAKES